jgi:hypothetical protein
MKRAVLIVLAAAIVLLFAGCAFEKTYHFVSGDTITGMCEQVTTNNSDIQNSLVMAGYTEGTCAAQGFGEAHYCTYTTGSGATSYEIAIYWGSDYDPAAIESACTTSGWTYH